MNLVIAIDGPASSGKGTLARRLASHYKLPHLDTGLLYRAVAAAMLEQNAALDDAMVAGVCARKLDIRNLDATKLRRIKLGEAASIVSAHGEVREALLKAQRDFAATPPGAVLDGRDIGTIVCPDAPVKLYVTASAEVRAARRQAEYQARGQNILLAEVLENIKKRDARDMGRANAPLKQAKDALLLDTSNLDIEEAFKTAVGMIDAVLKGKIHTGVFND